ncbi:MAG: DUF1292 domain-containing protein [Lachnospiraceae bacterium]|nr:DUF1292 domain-containing protein [Lachnospiraceae bacterium]
MNTVAFTDDENKTIEYEVIETTTLGGNTYLLVADEDDNAFILKERLSVGDEEIAAYTEELTDGERDAVTTVFKQLLDDEDIELD